MNRNFLILLIPLFLIIACSSSNGPGNGPDFDERYFPANDGDSWYFTSSELGSRVRSVEGDTTIEGVDCIRVRENGVTWEAWSIRSEGDSAGFYLHLLSFVTGVDTFHAWVEPPLRIPFFMEVDDTYNYSSDAYYYDEGDLYTFTIAGTFRFDGLTEKTVEAGEFTDVLNLAYPGYREYYARDVGLLDNGDYTLDSAFIDGEWIR